MRARVFVLAAALASVQTFAAEPLSAQGGAVTGTIVNKQTRAPLPGVQVYLQNTRHGTVTNESGAFLLPSVPAGTYTAVVQFIGFAQSTQTVTVTSGGTAQVRFELAEQVLPLQELVVSGVVDPTAGVKLPFTVARVSAEQLQVPPTGSAVAALAGKVAGASVIPVSGKPGGGVQIQLRTPTFSEGVAQNQPLYVVDGVVLSQTLQNPVTEGGGTAVQPGVDFLDIDPNDIESIEIIKGAAAASLYGSRASAGVISITTKRGRGTALGQTRINYRMEYGQDFVGREIPLSSTHHYRLTADGSRFADASGNPVLFNNRTTAPGRIQQYAWPGSIYNNTDLLYRPGQLVTQNLTLSQNNQNTNFVLAVNRLDQAGALRGNDGYWRNQGRLNLDHRIGDKFTVALTALHSRSWEDITSGNPYLEGMRFAPFVNLAARGEDGQYLQVPDSTVLIENPLWVQQTRDHYDSRTRTNGSVNTRFSPLQWLSLDAQMSYDRTDAHEQRYTPKGVPTSPTADQPSQGILELTNRRADAYNGSAAVTLLNHIGALTLRTSARASFERGRNEYFGAEGRDFIAEGTRDLSAAATLQDIQSSTQEIRSDAYMLNLGLDYQDRYVFDGLIRRDGSSLFGPEERWHTYYRAAGSYLISRESWFNVPNIDELVLRYSIGTAGGRPTFTQQYESWNVSRTTGLSRGTAGNAQLKPHTTREQEAGITTVLFGNRLSVELTYATQTSSNQIIGLAVPTISGFNSILGNAGKVKGWTYEGTVNARLLNSRDVTISLNAVADRSRNRILEWERACFMGHTITASLSNHEFSCAGESRGDIWGNRHLKDVEQLPAHLSGREAEFQLNNDGYLVWVGAGNTWRDGIAKSLWGTTTTSGGTTYFWGEPILDVDANNVPVFHRFGTMLPDVNFGFTPSLRYKNLNLYAEFRGQINGIVYNRAKQDLYNELRHADVDQTGKSDEEKKTIDYYQRALRSANRWIEHFVEDGTYLKVGALSARFRLPNSMLQRIPGLKPESMTLGVAGRNLFTFTGYSGFDPESGRALSRVETLSYPQLRSLTLTLDITF